MVRGGGGGVTYCDISNAWAVPIVEMACRTGPQAPFPPHTIFPFRFSSFAKPFEVQFQDRFP